MFSFAFVVLALSTSAFATVFVTAPTASTTMTGGQQATVSWMDDGKSPNLASFGPAKVSIYVGNAIQQTSLQLITASVDVSTTSTINFTPDATIGPNSNEYFIRFESISLKDPTQPQYPALAFSAKFTMSGMTGTFSPAISSQIAGQTTAPLAGPTASVASSASTTAASTSGASSASAKTSASGTASKTGSATASATKASNTGGARGRSAASVVAVAAGAAVGMALL